MGWVRISDDFYDHPKFADVTPLSIALWITSMAYCNRNLTDGYLPTTVAGRLLDFDGLAYETAGNDLCGVLEDDVAPLAIDHLLAAGLWHEQGHDCEDCPQPGRRRYYVHDYLVYQPSAAEIAAKREQQSAAGRKGASARWKGQYGESHGESHGDRHNESHGETDAIAMANPMAKSCPQPQPQPQPQSLPTEVKDLLPDQFDLFWNTYDHKVGRKKAITAYKAAIKKVSPGTLIATAEQYIAWQKSEGKHPTYTKHPATWLNGEHWNDERAARSKPQTRIQEHAALVEKLRNDEQGTSRTEIEA